MISDKEMFRLADRILERARKTLHDKTHDYGSVAWQTLGLRGTFADIHKKYYRLKNLIWDGNKPLVAESIDDTMQDLLGYALLGMIQLEHKKRRKRK